VLATCCFSTELHESYELLPPLLRSLTADVSREQESVSDLRGVGDRWSLAIEMETRSVDCNVMPEHTPPGCSPHPSREFPLFIMLCRSVEPFWQAGHIERYNVLRQPEHSNIFTVSYTNVNITIRIALTCHISVTLRLAFALQEN
jgi:hypothetical protein